MKKALLSLSAIAIALSAGAQQRVPLFEVFTSSTCPPCNAGNAIYQNVIASKPAGDYVSIKYQQNFPGTGDPYCTTEAVNRRSTPYGINSIPRMEIDGGWDQNAQSFTDALYTQYRAVPAKYTLTGTFSINSNKVVTAKVKYSPLVTVPAGAKLYVAIVESKTVQNVKTNGETAFFNVMKKMLPTETGTAITVGTIGQMDSTTLTFTFTGSFRLPADGATANRIDNSTEYSVEHFDSLKVVAWIQGTDKSVYQAGNLARVRPLGIANVSNTVSDVVAYPNPANSAINLKLTMNAADLVTATLYNATGAVVGTQTLMTGAGNGTVTFDTQNLAAGIYNLVVMDSEHNSFTQHVSVAH